jgi:hypothetical protein
LASRLGHCFAFVTILQLLCVVGEEGSFALCDGAAATTMVPTSCRAFHAPPVLPSYPPNRRFRSQIAYSYCYSFHSLDEMSWHENPAGSFSIPLRASYMTRLTDMTLMIRRVSMTSQSARAPVTELQDKAGVTDVSHGPDVHGCHVRRRDHDRSHLKVHSTYAT